MNFADLAIQLVIISASFFILAYSSDLILFSLKDYAHKLGLSKFLLGFTAISLASILPEMIASIIGAMMGKGEIVFATVFGSNLFKLPMIAAVLFITRKVKNDTESIGNAPILTLFLSILPIILAYDRNLGRLDGIILIAAYLVYLYSFIHNHMIGKIKKRIKFQTLSKDILIFIGSLVALILSARFLLVHTLGFSLNIGIPFYFLVIIFVGIGASLSVARVVFRNVVDKKEKLPYGNIMGIVVANSTLVLGITAILKPFSVPLHILINMGIFVVIGSFISIYFINKEELSWKHGILFVVFYLIFLVGQIMA